MIDLIYSGMIENDFTSEDDGADMSEEIEGMLPDFSDEGDRQTTAEDLGRAVLRFRMERAVEKGEREFAERAAYDEEMAAQWSSDDKQEEKGPGKEGDGRNRYNPQDTAKTNRAPGSAGGAEKKEDEKPGDRGKERREQKREAENALKPEKGRGPGKEGDGRNRYNPQGTKKTNRITDRDKPGYDGPGKVGDGRNRIEDRDKPGYDGPGKVGDGRNRAPDPDKPAPFDYKGNMKVNGGTNRAPSKTEQKQVIYLCTLCGNNVVDQEGGICDAHNFETE